MRRLGLVLGPALVACAGLFDLSVSLPAASADEGMWTLNNFPKDSVKKKYGFAPSDDWLVRARSSAVRLARGCSGSLVSDNGLVMTNHHCAQGCIKGLSSARQDLIKTGFFAKTTADERKCPDMEINQLVDITDVTARVQAATQGLPDAKFNEAQKAEMTRIEKECATDASVRCDVVTLYHGGRYDLYKYRRYQDVRLVFAPEFQMAFFGGDPDNFNFPRYDLDVSFVRVYEDGKPRTTPDHFRFSEAGAKEGELVFVAGHPGTTQRLRTVSELAFLRDVAFPDRLKRLAEIRGVLTEFARRGPEQKRISQSMLFGVENGFKAISGEEETLLDPAFFARKIADEKALRERVSKAPGLQKLYGGAWDQVAGAQTALKPMYTRLTFLERGAGFTSELFRIARDLVRAADERQKPSEKRLREYRESALPSLTQQMFSPAPIYPQMEQLTLGFSLSKLREALGADNEVVRKVLGKESPDDLARTLATGSKLYDVALRKKLWEGGAAAVAASNDPMIKLARLVDDDARAVRKTFEDQIEAVEKKNDELIAKAVFATQGAGSYPDATFTLRMTYGAVRGYDQGGAHVAPITTLGGAFARDTGKEPFALPQSWLASKDKLNLDTPLNFVSDCDIIGGNSGSPAFNKDGEIVGLIFDGNIQSLGGAFWFDESVNRAVAVHSAGLLEALRKIYHADRIVQELRPGVAASGMTQNPL